MRARRGVVAFACSALLLLSALTARAQTPPAGFVIDDAVSGGAFARPVQLVFMPNGHMLVVEKAGTVWVLTTNGEKLGTPFIDLSRKVLSNGDRGLLGVALDPDFATNR